MVIAIIVILAGLTLPALSSAREKSRTVNCLHNLKQIGLALQMYGRDWKDAFPPGDNGAAPWIMKSYHNLEPLYLGGYLSTYNVFNCPSQKNTTHIVGYQGAQWSYMCYAYANGLATNYSYASLKSSCPPTRAILIDLCGWGGEPVNHASRVNVLYGDGAVINQPISRVGAAYDITVFDR